MEYNLYGMGFVRLRTARFRGELPGRAGAPRAGWAQAEEVAAPESEASGAHWKSKSLISQGEEAAGTAPPCHALLAVVAPTWVWGWTSGGHRPRQLLAAGKARQSWQAPTQSGRRDA